MLPMTLPHPNPMTIPPRPKYEHIAIYGASQTGKSTLLRKFSRNSVRDCIIYDPTGEPCDWHNGWRPGVSKFASWKIFDNGRTTKIIDDPDAFARLVKKSIDADVFVDEAADVFSISQRDNYKIITKGRHDGLRIFFASQRPTMVAPTVRGQASVVYCFRLTPRETKEVFADGGHDIKNLTCRLPRIPGECVTVDAVAGMVHPCYVDCANMVKK